MPGETPSVNENSETPLLKEPTTFEDKVAKIKQEVDKILKSKGMERKEDFQNFKHPTLVLDPRERVRLLNNKAIQLWKALSGSVSEAPKPIYLDELTGLPSVVEIFDYNNLSMEPIDRDVTIETSNETQDYRIIAWLLDEPKPTTRHDNSQRIAYVLISHPDSVTE